MSFEGEWAMPGVRLQGILERAGFFELAGNVTSIFARHEGEMNPAPELLVEDGDFGHPVVDDGVGRVVDD